MKRVHSVLICVALSLLFVGLVSSCKDPVRVSHVAYIIGPDNIVSMDPTVAARIPDISIKASVLITTMLKTKKLKFCSGTLIEPASPGLPPRVLTNHHCFAETGDDGQSINKLLPEACNQTKVYLGFAPKLSTQPISFSCSVGSLRANFPGDLSIFTLTAQPPEEYKPLSMWEGDDPKDRDAYILHYPAVKENLAKPSDIDYSLPTQAATIDDCKVFGTFAQKEWHLDPTLPYALRHSCDLIHGSSGSALIDTETNTILGVNWGGIKISYSSGTRTDNVATKASYVKAFLDNAEDSFSNTGSSNAVAEVAVESKQASKKEKLTVQQKIKERYCGVEGASAAASTLLLLLGLLIPVATLIIRKSNNA